ncbi:MAG: hypothetical protein A2469_03660 [Candidatus Magasanikbacteria bacterium RIFOXYC2_FULL_40_16]|uniref:Uncharacterized protein n=3 Tax=Candidatus Magasanikiibacteriota TaxID=1752731 RepID=A0A1F6NIZ6_9BACT|nr:MAG: hypothetical protein A2224_03400 [Candidatus Magasanikbacteria bacterium RIFOXYA2_FULL_40_20]OGH83901.1 MAG: hypothetical protein A2373_00725 [Candidatus Magasanikbacteria bacterium RIFOXYB1_FULL_40_15]OGH87027.1 MAG: hypothetical protein A2301_02985 [Candidatus Magasanikbacteria bacterium RIFOXYB2_FULL_40_13]OGH87313.1 MAG: hypothetical protein A2206_00890 [Candidatus Magasanikbacteria bacterium RIFOXYA1_FULL_40_8]OGH90317.1 MAG: hypothetical protein A2469_03660 [Candidatus Magasanikba
MSSLKTYISQLAVDFEQETRRITESLKKIRRWRSSHKPGRIARLRRGLAIIFAWVASLFSALSRRVDSWNTTVENVLEHKFKLVLLIIRMLVVERARGNPHRLDFFRVLSWPPLHDMAEGDSRSEGDVNYWTKRKTSETEAASRNLEDEILQDIMGRLFSLRYRDFHPRNLDVYCVPIDEKIFWSAAEKIGFCLFMLEEIKIGRISRARQLRFYNNVNYKLVDWLRTNAWHFDSVREIVEGEIMPKWKALEKLVLRAY